jgi:hypothetical protein
MYKQSGDVGATRREWLVSMIGGSRTVEWEDVKLVLALKWQKAAREGRDGGDQGIGCYVCVYVSVCV